MSEITIAILATAILFSAFFSGVETALMSLNMAKVKALANQGKKGSKALYRIKQNPHRLIITILVGNNLVNIFAASLATVIFTEMFGSNGMGIATGVMTFLILVFGEIVPKTIAINKADGENVRKSEKAKAKYERLLHLLSPAYTNWIPPVLTCSALEMKNLDRVWETVLQHREKLGTSGELEEKRKKQSLDWMWSLLEEGLRERYNRNASMQSIIPQITDQLTKGIITPTAAAYKLLRFLDK